MATLGDRMRTYEGMETDRRFIPRLPIIARLDGRSFHSFARGLAKPYDERLSRLMISTTKFLVEESCCRIGYTQSDEIYLLYFMVRALSQKHSLAGRYSRWSRFWQRRPRRSSIGFYLSSSTRSAAPFRFLIAGLGTCHQRRRRLTL